MIKALINLSKALYLSIIAMFLSKEFEGIGNIYRFGMEAFIGIFYVVSGFLVFVSLLSCFKRLRPQIDFSVIFPELEPIPKNFFSSPMMKRFIHVFSELSYIVLYFAIIWYVQNPSLDQIYKVSLSFTPLIFSYVLKSMEPRYKPQDLSRVLPEWSRL
jgi:hypothetical protein